MNMQLVGTLVAKDLSLYFRNRFFAFITVLGIVFYIIIYFLMPQTVDETFDLAFYAPEVPQALADTFAEEGVVLNTFDTEAGLRQAILDGDYDIGIALPPEAMQAVAQGEQGQVNLYLNSTLPEGMRETAEILMQELGFLITGQALNFQANEEILGPDLAGAQIPPRDRMLPLLAVFVLIIEMMGLASLISTEVAAGTLRALFVTPVTVPTLFVGKTITGMTLAFVQALLLVGITGGLSQQPLLVIVILLLGALMATGIGFLIATTGHDMMSVMATAIPVLVILAVPAFNVLLPGIASNWIKIIPSFYLVDSMHRVLNFDAGWGDVGSNLLILFAASLVILGLGIVALRRKFS